MVEFASKGDSEALVKALEAGISPDFKGKEGYTALIIAAHNGHLKCCKLLLARGADPNFEDTKRGTALMAAASAGNPECVSALLAAGAALNARRLVDASNALYFACHAGHTECARLLLEAGAELGWKNSRGLTPLMAVVEGAGRALQGLVHADKKRLESVDKQKDARRRYKACLQVVLRHEPNLETTTINGSTPLIVAAGRSDIDFVRMLLSAGADIEGRSYVGNSALAAAVQVISLSLFLSFFLSLSLFLSFFLSIFLFFSPSLLPLSQRMVRTL